MTRSGVEVLTAGRLPELLRKVCAYAGLPTRSAPAPGEHFVVRCGREAPELIAKLLEEALAEEAPEVAPFDGADDPVFPEVPAGRVLVRQGYDSPCPISPELQQVAGLGGVLVLAVERRDDAGRLLGVTWAGLPDELPLPEVPLAAAVSRQPAAP